MSIQFHKETPRANTTTVAIVGNLNLDIRTSPIFNSDSILKDGETSIDEIYESVGGGGANTATAVALMGGLAHFCCAIGDDELGKRLCRFMEGIGVRVHAAIKPVATGRSVALTWNNHQRHFVSSLPNTRLLDELDIDLEALRNVGCRHLYRADPWFSDRMFPLGNSALLRRAREIGMETSLDINWDPKWSHERNMKMKEVQERISWLKSALPYVSFVHGNDSELAFFAGVQSAEECARQLMEWGAGAVIVHRGARGCAAATDGDWIEVAAGPIAKIVNEAGTGDVFTAAFLLGVDLPLEDRLRRSASAAEGHVQGIVNYIPRLGDRIYS
jgi:sugar/nucleoside kinase (ribokinase family)